MIKRVVYDYASYLALIAVSFIGQCLATPLNNVFDTQPLYTVYGSDKFYNRREKTQFKLHFSPFYQQTSTVRNGGGHKVRAGNRLGKWNMFGIFFGRNAETEDFTLPVPPADVNANYPHLAGAYRTIGNTTSKAQTDPVSRYLGGKAPLERASLTEDSIFLPERQTFAYVDVPLNYEKIGLRTQFTCDLKCGFGVGLKAGVVDIKQKFDKFVLETQFATDAGFPASTTPTNPDAVAIYNALFEASAFAGILKDLDLEVSTFHKTSPEDIHVSVYWHWPIHLRDKQDEILVTAVPYLSVGAWLPVSKKHDSRRVFFAPSGNDGFYGLTAEASIAFDFPVIPSTNGSLQINAGGGIAVFNEKDFKDERVLSASSQPPNAAYVNYGGADNPKIVDVLQSGIIPWKTTISREPGLIWYMNGSMKAENFIENLSFFIDYMYTQHLHDEIKVREPNDTRKKAFELGAAQMERQSVWKNQQVNLGLSYEVAPSFFLGGAIQAHLTGVRVYRSTTLLANMMFKF